MILKRYEKRKDKLAFFKKKSFNDERIDLYYLSKYVKRSQGQKKIIKNEGKYVAGNVPDSRFSRLTLAETREWESEKAGHYFSLFYIGNKYQIIIIAAHSENENTHTQKEKKTPFKYNVITYSSPEFVNIWKDVGTKSDSDYNYPMGIICSLI